MINKDEVIYDGLIVFQQKLDSSLRWKDSGLNISQYLQSG